MTNIEKEIKRLSNLRQNKNKELFELENQARINVWKKQLNIEDRFSENKEKKLANSLLENYLQNFMFEDYNEILLLGDLIYDEILLIRSKDAINKVFDDENNRCVPTKSIEILHQIEDKILDKKIKLGIVKSKDKDDLTALEALQKKFEVYIPFNRNEFTLWLKSTCSKCQHEEVHSYLLRRRVKDFDFLKHPAFSGRFLYNYAIFDDVKKGLITKEQAASYLRCSVFYIDWVLKNEMKIISIGNVSQERVDDFVNKTPYLRNAEDYKEK